MKNVILITIDCLRADKLQCFGSLKKYAQNIDEFANNSLVFKNCYSNGTNTSSSFCSIFTSKYSSYYPFKELIVGDKIRPLLVNQKTLSHILQKHGFNTIGIHSNPVLNICHFDRDFIIHKEVLNENGKRNNNYSDRIFKLFLNDKKANARAEIINNVVRDCLLSHTQKKPLFLWIHYMDLHNPYTPKHYWPFCTPVKLMAHKLGGNVRKKIDEYFYNLELRYLDKNFKKLIKILEENKINDKNTLFIITSDHGEEFFEHGGFYHSGKPYDELIHVPLIIKNSDLKKGYKIYEIVSLIDVTPTILDFLEIPLPNGFNGKSIPLKNLDSIKPRLGVISEYIDNNMMSLCYRTLNWKYMITYTENRGIEELYDLKNDPLEKNNLIDNKKIKEIFRSVLQNHFKKNSIKSLKYVCARQVNKIFRGFRIRPVFLVRPP